MKRFGKVSAGTALLALVPGLPGAFLPGLPGLHLKPKTPPNAAAGDEAADLARLIPAGRVSGGEREGGRVMTGWLQRSREAAARLVRNPARPAVGRAPRGGTGAVAAAGLVLGSWLFPLAPGAQIAGTWLATP